MTVEELQDLGLNSDLTMLLLGDPELIIILSDLSFFIGKMESAKSLPVPLPQKKRLIYGCWFRCPTLGDFKLII